MERSLVGVRAGVRARKQRASPSPTARVFIAAAPAVILLIAGIVALSHRAPSEVDAPRGSRTDASWERLGTGGPGPLSGALGVAMDREVIVLGGHTARRCADGTPCGTAEARSAFGMLYNIDLRQWFPMADAPIGLDDDDAVVVVAHDVYILTATRRGIGDVARSFLRFDRLANAWESLATPSLPQDVEYSLTSDAGQPVAFAMSEGERPAVDFRFDRAAGWRQFPPAPHRVSDTRAYRHLNEQLLLVSRDGSDGTGEVRVTALDGSKWRELPAPGGSGELPTELNGLLAFASAAPGGGTMPVEILGSDLVWRPLASGTRNDVESPPLNLLGPTSSYYPSLYGQVLDIWMADLVTMPDPPGRLLELRHPTTVAVGTDLFVFGGDVVRGSASVPTNESFLFHAPVWIPADD